MTTGINSVTINGKRTFLFAFLFIYFLKFIRELQLDRLFAVQTQKPMYISSHGRDANIPELSFMEQR